MTRQNLLRGSAAAAALVALSAFGAARATFAADPAAKAGSPVVLCAVKGERIADPAKAAGKADYKGKTLYFCCPGCVTAFGKADDAGKARFAKLTELRTEKITLSDRLKAVESELGTLESAKPAAAATKTAASNATLHCAVTGEEIASVEAASGKREYKGKTYYFCCPGCDKKFDADPAKYAAAADARDAKK
jgi:YHS domain-containing protein